MKSKIVSALVAIAFAFGLWLYVITVESPGSDQKYYNIPVVFEGETILKDRKLMITSGTPADVDLHLSGNRSDLDQVNSANITVKADLTKIYDPGQHELEYTISYPGSVASNAFTEENRDPDRILVTVERVETKEVPVEIIYTGSLPQDFSYDKENALLDYPVINVKGPLSVVEQIAKARISVDLNGRNESISQNFKFTLCNEAGAPVDAELITVNTQEIHLDLKIQRVKEVKLTVTIVDGGGATAQTATYDINPQTIKVSGSEAALEGLDSINLGTINLGDYLNATPLPFQIPQIEGVTNLTGVTEAVVDLKFPGLTNKEITVESIELINIPEGMTAELITEKITLIIRGPSSDMAKLMLEDVKITVDLTGAEAGTSTYKAKVVIGAYPALGAVGAYSANVTVEQEGA